MSQLSLTDRPLVLQLGATPSPGVSLLSYLLSAEALVYAALFFYVLGFLFRDELWLRGLLFAGTMFYILYYYYAAESPLWEAIITSSILGLVNLWMIVVVILERTTFSMTADTAALYGHFQTLTPGQFRRMIKVGKHLEAEKAEILCQEAKPLNQLYFIYDGHAEITKRGVATPVPVGHFVGEVAFLKGSSATATVRVEKGSRYLAWTHADLQRVMQKSPNLRNGLLALLNIDMAGKIASSQPVSG